MRRDVLRLGILAMMAASTAQADDPPMVQAGLGATGLRDSRDKPAVAAEAQIRGPSLWWHIQPQVGLMATHRGSVYGWGGFVADIPIIDRIHLIPGLAVGGYAEGGGKDLGNTFQFRDSVEIAYVFDGGDRLGAEIFHLSDAGISLRNPGVEGIMLTVGVPFPAP